jgi:pimeloyl-ACP methyl ester carboxylesterase
MARKKSLVTPVICWLLRVSLSNLGPLSFLRLLYNKMFISLLLRFRGQKFSHSRCNSKRHFLSAILSCWLNAEGVFFIFSFLDRFLYGKSLRLDQPSHYPEFSSSRRLKLWNRITKNLKDQTQGQNWIKGWFGNCSYNDLRVDNLREFFAWGWFDQIDCQQLNQEELNEVESKTQAIQDMYGPLKEGFNSNIKTQRQSIDPWFDRTTSHPLIFYVGVGFIEYVAAPIVMRYLLGFRLHQKGRQRYWYHDGGNDDCSNGGSSSRSSGDGRGSNNPIVFFHGIGVGLAPYYNVMKSLLKLSRPLYVGEIPEATMSMSTSVPFYHSKPTSIKEFLSTWDKILPKDMKYSIVGHSYGTFISSWFLEHRKDRLINCCLVDPVSIMLHHADVCDQFLYGGISSFKAQRGGKTQKDLLMQYLVREEPGIVLTLMRNFWWYKNTTWLDDLSSCKSGVLLGTADEYIAVDKIVGGIEEFNSDIRVGNKNRNEQTKSDYNCWEQGAIWLKTYRGVPHGIFLFHKRMQNDMLKILNRQ